MDGQGVIITQLTVANTTDGLIVYGVDVKGNISVQIPWHLFEAVAKEALARANSAYTEAEKANNALSDKIESKVFSSNDYPEI